MNNTYIPALDKPCPTPEQEENPTIVLLATDDAADEAFVRVTYPGCLVIGFSRCRLSALPKIVPVRPINKVCRREWDCYYRDDNFICDECPSFPVVVEMMELRAYYPGGIKVWDCHDLEHGWRLWASFSKDKFFATRTQKVVVVPRGTPL